MSLFDFIFRNKKREATTVNSSELKMERPSDLGITINGKTANIKADVLAKTMPLFDKAKILYGATQYAESAKVFGQLIELQPDNANWYTYRGTAYEDMGIDSKAKPDFYKAISLNPKDSLALYRLGMLYTRENNNEKAVEYLQRAFDNIPLYIENPMGKELDNTMLFVHKKKVGNNLGSFLCQLGKNKEAYEVLDDVIANCPDYSYAYFTKGLALANEGKYIESAPLVQMAQKLGHPRAAELLAKLTTIMMGSKPSFSSNNSGDLSTTIPEVESFVDQALDQLERGNDGDATYHPLYKAWKSICKDPKQLRRCNNIGKIGTGFAVFLSYDGTIRDINDRQHIASVSYLCFSLALKESPKDVNLLKNRLTLTLIAKEVFQYTISSVINKDQSSFKIMTSGPWKVRDALYKMQYADLAKDKRLLSKDVFADAFNDLQKKINDNFFGADETIESIIEMGNKYHDDVLKYLEEMVIENENVYF